MADSPPAQPAVSAAVKTSNPSGTAQQSNLVKRLKRGCYSSVPSPNRVYLQTANRYAADATRVLDVGCGRTAAVLADLAADGALKVGVDLVEDLNPPPESRVRAFRSDCNELPFATHSFDLVMCRSVLEHLERPSLAFAEFQRVLVPGGHFVFLTPNWWDYVSLAASAIPNRHHPAVVRLLTGRNEEDTFPTRYRANTTATLRKLARYAGFHIVTLKLLREHPHYLQLSAIPYVLGLLYEQTLARCVAQLRPWILGVVQRPDTV